MKLNNQSKICKILQQSPDIKVADSTVADTETIEPLATDRIKSMLEECKKELESLQGQKE